jgi:hypothetical protein
VEDRTTFKVYPTEPLPALFRELERHVAATGQPETFPGIHPGPLSSNEPFTRLGKVELNPNKRPEGDLAPCPMCHSPNKFKTGWFVYLHNLKAVAVIGNECACKDTRDNADREWREREERRREENHMERLIPLLPSWLRTFESAAPTIHTASILLKSFRREGKAFLKALSSAANDSGTLVVHEVVKSVGGPQGIRTSGSNTQMREIAVGRLVGLKALSTRFNPQSELESLAALTALHVQSNEEAELEFITTVGPLRRQACRDLLKVEREYPLLVKSVEDCREFFSPTNLSVLAEWGAHPLATLGFELTITETPTGTRLSFYTPGELWYPIIPPILWTPLPSLPDNNPTALAA